jgi:ribosomal protein L39E
MTRHFQKKIKLGVAGRKIKWAPIWAVLRKYGQGQSRATHPSSMTKLRRAWRRTKLKIKPRKMKKKHLG